MPEEQFHTKVYKDSKDEWRWDRIASNGNIVADSGEGYKNRAHCISMVQEMFPDDTYEFQED